MQQLNKNCAAWMQTEEGKNVQCILFSCMVDLVEKLMQDGNTKNCSFYYDRVIEIVKKQHSIEQIKLIWGMSGLEFHKLTSESWGKYRNVRLTKKGFERWKNKKESA